MEADRAQCAHEVTELRSRLDKMFADFRPLKPKSRRRKKDTDPTEPFNPNSHPQIVAALAAHGIEVADSKAKTLGAIDSPETRALLDYNRQKKLLETIEGTLAAVFPDGRVRASHWNQLAAVTGRIHSSDPNFQNLPRRWRYGFEAPTPFQWLKVDLSQIEVYILAIVTEYENLIRMLAEGKDVYVMVAADLWNLKPERGEGADQVNDLKRKIAKTLVLGIAYGLGLKSFIARVEAETRPGIGQQGHVIEWEEAREFFAKFFRMFPRVRAYQNAAERKARTDEAVYTVTGQRRFLPPLLDDQREDGYWPSLEARKRRIINTPIQGGAANQFIRAAHKARDFIPRTCKPSPGCSTARWANNPLKIRPREITYHLSRDIGGLAFGVRRSMYSPLPISFATLFLPSWKRSQSSLER
jgi:DNA polymerase I-like protein with 3'-5' exonuclease and polymerase domains